MDLKRRSDDYTHTGMCCKLLVVGPVNTVSVGGPERGSCTQGGPERGSPAHDYTHSCIANFLLWDLLKVFVEDPKEGLLHTQGGPERSSPAHDHTHS